MTNEKKNATLEDLIMEMLKEGKAVRVPMKDVVDKLQENAKASEDVQPEVAQPETEQPEKVLQDEQVKTVPINIRIDSLHIHMDERIGRMGGGALSGKDPTKVDRSAAYMARKIAKDIVQAGYADKCEVQLAYAIGVVQPVGVSVECFGTEHQPLDFIEAYVHDSYDLTPQGIIQRLGLLDVDYNKVSVYGHFGKAGLPWEK